MADGDTYIDLGGTLEVVQALPATFDAVGFAAQTYVQTRGVLTIPETGDSAEDVNEPTLEDGRVEHFFGVLDGGTIDIVLKHIEADPGQLLVIPNRNYNLPWSFKITDSDGTITYKHGRIGPVRRRERSPSGFKAHIMPLVFNSEETRVDPA